MISIKKGEETVLKKISKGEETELEKISFNLLKSKKLYIGKNPTFELKH